MQRILEPEYMDTVEESNDYDAMDHGSANGDFVERFTTEGGGQGDLLDIGTGPGHIPLLLAAKHPDARITAIDAAQTMLDLAERKLADSPYTDRIKFQRADAKALPFDDGSFDGVISNTILHHIPEPLGFLREAWRVLRPGGLLVIRDLFRPATEADAWALVNLHAEDGTDSQRQLLFDSLHAALTLDEARTLVAEAGIEDASVEMNSDRHYTIVARNR